MSVPTPLPGRDADKPSVLDGMSKQDLKVTALAWLDKAKTKHQEARHWRNRCLSAEAELDALRASRGQS
jgi:hypothetical protein